MLEGQYEVILRTHLGNKNGILYVLQSGEHLSGSLDILGHAQPFEGTIDESGNCKICGTMITLLHTVSYQATGKITASHIELQLRAKRNVFELSGGAR